MGRQGAAAEGLGGQPPLPGEPFFLRLRPLLILCGVFTLVANRACEAQLQGQPRLPPEENAALRAIATKLKVKGDLPPCDSSTEYYDTKESPLRRLACDCNATTNVCHVVRIQLKSQNLAGSLPEELAKLKSLIQIDLTRNYLNGTIPASWASLPLVNISLLGNRLSGRIPDAFGNISTLQEINLENNLLGGPLPSALGRLKNLKRMLLSANNFTGEIPETFADLINLTDFRIDGNAISGRIPIFIGNWSKLARLDIQGTSLEGPFPATFIYLKVLAELRITDFKGDGSPPPLDAKMMHRLVLRNCNISGPIPPYIAGMTDLKALQ